MHDARMSLLVFYLRMNEVRLKLPGSFQLSGLAKALVHGSLGHAAPLLRLAETAHTVLWYSRATGIPVISGTFLHPNNKKVYIYRPIIREEV